MMRVRDPAALREAIAARGMTAIGVSRYAGLKSKSFVSMLANGQRSVCNRRVASRIAEALGVGIDELFVPTASSGRGHDPGSPRTRTAA